MGIEPLGFKHIVSSKRSNFLSVPYFLLGELLSFNFRIQLDIFSLLRSIWHNLVLVSNDCNLDCVLVRLDLYSLLEIVVDLLYAIKALYSMVVHSVGLISFDWRHGLNESNHGLVAVSIKLIVISRFKRLEFIWAILCWFFWYLWLHRVFEVSQESKTILKFDLESLIVDGWPRSSNLVGLALATLGAVGCLSKILIHDLYFPWICVIEAPFVVIRYDLQLVRKFVSTHFVNLEQVYFVSLLSRVEVPHSVNLASQTVDWLVCFDLSNQAVLPFNKSKSHQAKHRFR